MPDPRPCAPVSTSICKLSVILWPPFLSPLAGGSRGVEPPSCLCLQAHAEDTSQRGGGITWHVSPVQLPISSVIIAQVAAGEGHCLALR